MWDQIRRWFGARNDSKRVSHGAAESEYRWYDPGGDNPFPVRILDVRKLTWNVFAMTSDAKIAESYDAQRRTAGREYIDATIENSTTIDCHLAFPHNGAELEGVVFKSDSMDVKWDIYIYRSALLFVRSWTGQLAYRAFARITDTEIRIFKIEAPSDQVETAPQAVYFLLATHALGCMLPHTIPRHVPNDPQQIAVLSFSMYGNRACFATYEDITQIPLSRPDAAGTCGWAAGTS